jgi:hypothetical protein
MPYLHWNIIGSAKIDHLKGLDLVEINSAISCTAQYSVRVAGLYQRTGCKSRNVW